MWKNSISISTEAAQLQDHLRNKHGVIVIRDLSNNTIRFEDRRGATISFCETIQFLRRKDLVNEALHKTSSGIPTESLSWTEAGTKPLRILKKRLDSSFPKGMKTQHYTSVLCEGNPKLIH